MPQTQTATTGGGESFAALFEESLKSADMRVGEVISAEVVRIDFNHVVVNAGLKSEAYVPVEEFKNDQGELEVQVGDFVSVAVEAVENGYGDTILSRDKAKRLASWMSLENALESGEFVTGTVSGKVKGGLTVLVNGIRAFLPGSLLDTRPVKDMSPFEGKTLEFKVIKLDRKRNNVVLSRRAVVEASMGEERAKLLETLHEGAIVNGVVKNITEYGAFVDLGGIDGLLHITDMAWRRVRHPSEVVQVGQELTAKVLKFDAEKSRVSLGLKQLGDDPWHGVSRRYPTGTRLFGKVTNIADYGAFVEIEPGIEGLVHVSEMDWTNKNVAPSKVVTLGDEVEVMVLEIDEEKRRISLGMKQCMANPWEEFAVNVKRGDRVAGPVKSITDFGIFIGLASGIDGLVHLSDLSWNEPGESAVRNYKKGQEVEAIVLAVDVERERISLGIKQLDTDPFTSFTTLNDRGAIVNGKVMTVDPRGAEVQLTEDVTGLSARQRDQPRPCRGCAQRAQGRRRRVGDDRQHRPQDAQHPALDQGQGQRRHARGDAAPVAEQRARNRRHHQPGRPAARQAGQSERIRRRLRHDAIRPRQQAGRALRPADAARHRVRGEDDPRRDVRRARARAPHRDPRFRQLLDQPPAAARGAQPAQRRAGDHPREAGAALQAGQGPARGGRRAHGAAAGRSVHLSGAMKLPAFMTGPAGPVSSFQRRRPGARSYNRPRMRVIVWLLRGLRLLRSVRLRAEQPAGRGRALVLRHRLECAAGDRRPDRLRSRHGAGRRGDAAGLVAGASAVP
jgi:small subunit ribosomal protein S1